MSVDVARRMPLANEPDRIMFTCPGCNDFHAVTVIDDGGAWGWNGSLTAPTFTPSVLVTGVGRCHSFVTDGHIRFLNDCTHALAGTTVALPAVE